MANGSRTVQIETRIKHDFSIAFQSVIAEQSVNVGTLVMPDIQSVLVFANLRGGLNLKQPTIPVLRSEELVAFIEKNAYDAANRKDRADPARIAELKRAIVHRLHEIQSAA